MLDINALRNAFKKSDKGDSGGQNNYYRFWDMNVGSTATLRFLPDANPNNPMGFLVEKAMHTLIVNGNKQSVPCLKMYGEDCPVCKVSAAYYAKDDKINGKRYYKQKQHLAQALIVQDPLPPDAKTGETAENKVKLLSINYSLYKIIKSTFEQGDLDEVPYAYDGGTNFIIQKDMQGEYASYVLSKFARKSTTMPDSLVNELSSKLVDLSTLLPKNPGREKVEALLEADLSGSPMTESGSDTDADDAPPVQKSAKMAKMASAFADDEDDIPPPRSKAPPVASTLVADNDADADANDALAAIRARQQAKRASTKTE